MGERFGRLGRMAALAVGARGVSVYEAVCARVAGR